MLDLIRQTRRDFLTTSACGLGGLALTSALAEDAGGLGPGDRAPHFAPRAKRCIFIFMAGAPSQLDLFDPKPELVRFDGQPLPESMTKNVRFAFIKKESATLMASRRSFRQYGQSGMWFSDLVPHIAQHADDITMVRTMVTNQFNHHPGQLVMQCGKGEFGLPTMGSWLTYGLGSENRDLPGYVVLTAGRGSSGGATLWQSGFLPSEYSGVRFRSQGEPVLNLSNPPGITPQWQRRGLDALKALNEVAYERIRDQEILSRIENYELAFRMQSAAPELVDLSGETEATRRAYGLDREDLDIGASHRGGAKGQYGIFARNCLLARRLVERGVRFVNLIHASWDHHSNLDRELRYNAGMADQPIGALLADLKQRGLLDDTLVVWGSEFGRTSLGENRPGREANTGRDHHPYAFSMWMAGGGVRGGLTYGTTDDFGWGVAENPVHVNDFQATLLHLFGMDHKRLTYPHKGAEQKLTTLTRPARVMGDWLA